MGIFKKESEEEKQAKKEKGNYVSYRITPDMNEKDVEILKRAETILAGRGLQSVGAKLDTVILRDYIQVLRDQNYVLIRQNHRIEKLLEEINNKL